MSRLAVLCSVLVALVGSLATVASPGAIAQSATPEAEPSGSGFETLARGPAADWPTAPGEVVLVRFTLAPGEDFPHGDDPSFYLVYVESGSLTLTMTAPVTVWPAGAAGSGATPTAVAAGADVVLGTGDSATLPPGIAGEFRNDGAEPVVGLLIEIDQEEGPSGTPAP